MAKKEASETVSGSLFDFQILLKLMRYVNPYRLIFFLVITFTISVSLFAIAKPLVVKHALDVYVVRNDARGLWLACLLLVLLLLAHGIVSYLNTWLAGKLGQSVIRDLRNELFEKIINFRLSFFDKTPNGRIVTRVVSDIESLANLFSEGLAGIVSDILLIVAILAVMLYTDWLMTLCSLGALPLLLISTYIFKEKIKKTFNEVRNAVAQLNSFVQEHISGMSIVQLFNSEEREYKKFERINQEHRDANLKSVLYYSVYFPVAEFISAVSTALLIWYASRAAGLNHSISPGVMTAFLMYLTMFFRPIRMIADRFNTIQMAIVSCDRVFKLLEEEHETTRHGNYKKDSLRGAIEFDQVSFSYDEVVPVLKSISFSIQPGERIAFVGSTGAGKSTITSLLNGFYSQQQGDIRIDGVPIQEYDLPWLRSRIGIVMQDVFLFSDTIRNNITLHNPSISDEKINEAIALVGAAGFIQQLPGGLDFQVMERGATLSVGQRQLISFLRVLCSHPDIVILDEATASIDSETELLLQKALDVLLKGRTCILIAHRLSTIQKASCIHYLEHGKITESGTHEELLHLQGGYAELCKMQYLLAR
ncbi:MAG: ABC transporter ATP-binding protein/permease [Cytophagaceae bacterium]|jgi:ATP-binding cassette subfamily B protein|nr:ABC transporter ATP-binding protein/permease [Cytophagaceae bacterium]